MNLVALPAFEDNYLWLLHDDGGVITVAFVNWVYGLNKKIAHGPVSGIFPCDNLRMTERWWMA